MKSLRSPKAHVGIFGLGMLAVVFGVQIVLPTAFATSYHTIAAVGELVPVVDTTPRVPHQQTPDAVKGIYMSQCVVGTPSFRESLLELIKDTELNSVVIDIKDFTGYIAFTTDNPLLKDSVSKQCGAPDMAEFVKTLHAHGIYVIGRITVFQDPRYTKLHPEQSVQSVSRPGEPWRDHKGLSFISPLAKPYWEYVIELSRVAYEEIGFDELNYDYIRWPSDGNMKDVAYPPDQNRAEAIEHFWQYLGEHRPKGAKISADLFGYTAVLTDDLGIGQVLERALPYFDYVMPMVYPSHYNKGFAGLANVNSDPYKVIKISMDEAVRRTVATSTTVAALTHTPIMTDVLVPAHGGLATTTEQKFSGLYTKPVYSASKMRPWLQDFNYPVPYTPEMVAAQIKANEDSGLNSYVFWDAGNKYTSLRKVLANTPTTAE